LSALASVLLIGDVLFSRLAAVFIGGSAAAAFALFWWASGCGATALGAGLRTRFAADFG
jgi:hypothetical protein